LGCVCKATPRNIFTSPQFSPFVATKKNSGGSLLSPSTKMGGTMLVVGLLAASVGLVLGLRFSVITFIVLTVAILVMFAMSVLGGSSPLVVAFHILVTLLPSKSVISLALCLLHIFPCAQ
jgi:hypothetical protein